MATGVVNFKSITNFPNQQTSENHTNDKDTIGESDTTEIKTLQIKISV